MQPSRRRNSIKAVFSVSSSSVSSQAGQFGPNEWLVEEMYQRFLDDPTAVDPAWHDFFADYRPEGLDDGLGDGPGGEAAANGAARDTATTGTAPKIGGRTAATPKDTAAATGPATPKDTAREDTVTPKDGVTPKVAANAKSAAEAKAAAAKAG